MRSHFAPIVAVALCVTSAARATAQCPDGTPPPCRGAVVRQASARRDPVVNPRLWIVAPFGNATKAADLDWLRDASVNLLSMDMGRWTDVAVVPDKRVGDFVRELPAAKRNESLTLNDGIAMARRAGAAHLVMGDFFKLGKATRLVANVFDVATGARVRSITQEAADADSLLTALGASDAGTSVVSADAYLLLGDTTSAQRIVRFFLDSAMAFVPIDLSIVNGIGTLSAAGLLPRAMLLRADLAMAKDLKDEARTWYLRVLDLWGSADAELKPTIDRIRAALMRLDAKA